MFLFKLKKEFYLPLIVLGLVFSQCKISPKKSKELSLSQKGLEMGIRMAESEMLQFPDASTVDFNSDGKWCYTAGLVSQAMVELSEQTNDTKYYEYAKRYADKYINKNGKIIGYNKSKYNIDQINSGKFLFTLYNKTKDARYKIAIDTLRTQLKEQPRTSEGGFWHKKRYENQMWLDGLYMGSPFLAQYAKVFNTPSLYNDVSSQFLTVHKHTYDSIVGLNYHGWDESKQQRWANPKTGCSSHFWGRSMGWYAMAIVDALDYIPETYPKRDSLITILNQVCAGIKKYQDKETGLWYQIIDKGGKEGNYQEASASSMFVYALSKAVRKGYVSKQYKSVAKKGYNGILKTFIRENKDGTISLTKVCAVAGLGGNPYRDGSYEYYINEPVRDNDPKGVGSFILASIEITQ